MITTRIDLIDKDVFAQLLPEVTPAERSAALAAFARDALAEAQEVNTAALGAPPAYETVVDGRTGAAPESVAPEGTIVFRFEVISDLLAWIGSELIAHSPVLTGTYRDSHLFFADGTECDPGGELPRASEYLFLSPLPYAGKIERGESAFAPDGVYQAVAALAKRRFGNAARIRFTYRTLAGATPQPGRGHTRSKEARADRRPAIVITVN